MQCEFHQWAVALQRWTVCYCSNHDSCAMPAGHLVIWSSGHLVIWSSGHLVIWSSGHLVELN
ncbi:hypothetical protein [Acinetobacter lwoffii]|uniref:hypothetical protein n=1 Tax=Acinetobacter lwoffii TaxID=28090 RepID=UPI00110CA885|nr:hypothetical protein [Acinetobacter lwoffii]TMS52345.1 hypothetical protein FGQ54_05285 [Acinetobacter lwoffii]